MDDVTIRPIAPKPSLFPEPTGDRQTAQDIAPEKAFIPPQPAQTGQRGPRMPRIEDLPLPAQNEIRAKRERSEGTTEKRLSLLQRLASVGLGRRQNEEEPEAQKPQPRPAARPAPVAERPQSPPNRPQETRPVDPLVSEYAKRSAAPRPAPQGLDVHGRPAPMAPSIDDDQLEIPAFLRRQAN
jgi:cell division protein FtsZ